MANKKKNNYVSKDKLGNNFVHKESKEEKNKSPKDILLSIKNASYRYSDAKENDYALKNVSFDFEEEKYML